VWCRAGIQVVGDNNKFKDLDSCFHRNDVISPYSDTISGAGRG